MPANQTLWCEYIEPNMSDVLDAYSVHIYWNYWDLARMEFRLAERPRDRDRRPDRRTTRSKPLYVTEFGVRGIQNIPPASR